MEGASHVVAHLLREVESALRDILEVMADSANKSAGEGHKAEILSILNALEIPETDPVAQAWLFLAEKGSEYSLPARAHRHRLAQPRPIDQEFRQFWDELETILDTVLDRFEAKYLGIYKFIDNLLTNASPSKNEVKILLNNVPNNPQAFRHFFKVLDNDAWLTPLKEEGFFKNPPEIIWPGYDYLRRMASSKPDLVAEILSDIPSSPRGTFSDDLAEIVLAIPPDIATKLISNIKAWVGEATHAFFPRNFGELISHLANGEQVTTALDLARELLDVVPDRDVSEEGEIDVDGVKFEVRAEPKGRFDDYYYGKILKKNMPALVSKAGLPAMVLLCDLLEKSLQIKRLGKEESQDYSYIWRPAIEEDKRIGGVKNLLVSAVRDAAEQLIRENLADLKDIIGELNKYKWNVFKRLRLHLLRLFYQEDQELLAEHLTDYYLFDEPDVHHEYFLLAQEFFSHLKADDQSRILSWITEGPSYLAEWRESREQQIGKPVSVEEVERYRKSWWRYKLTPIAEALPQEWRKLYEDLMSELGPPKHPQFLAMETSWVGPTSPKSLDDLHSMAVEEIIEFIETWNPPLEPMTPSPEGLGRILSEAISEKPEEFAANAAAFKGLDPTYVRSLFSALTKAVDQGRQFPWQPVLDLAHWVVNQPIETPGRKNKREYLSIDPDFGWTRKAIVNLLSAGFKSDGASIPFELRPEAWKVLRPLTNDPDPTPDDEAESTNGPSILAINTTRGEALHAVLSYALWVRQRRKEIIGRGFGEMPEVQEVLESHLDPNFDPSLAIRSVYGRWFPWLKLLDHAWVEEKLPLIFPLQETYQDFRNAAWESYIIFCPPYDDVFEVLQGEYRKAIDQIGGPSLEKGRLADPDEHLAEHLMAFYWRGKLDLGDPEGMLTEFFARVPDMLCAHALNFLGRSLYDEKEKIPDEVRDRLKRLWECRITLAGKEEAAAFGWWFAAKKFDDSWALAQLKKAIEIAGKTDPDHLVTERLAELASTFPGPVVECLSLMAQGDKKGWLISSWRDDAHVILENALKSDDPEAMGAATALINRLAARGYSEYRELIS